jgi:hypothetical protein
MRRLPWHPSSTALSYGEISSPDSLEKFQRAAGSRAGRQWRLKRRNSDQWRTVWPAHLKHEPIFVETIRPPLQQGLISVSIVVRPTITYPSRPPRNTFYIRLKVSIAVQVSARIKRLMFVDSPSSSYRWSCSSTVSDSVEVLGDPERDSVIIQLAAQRAVQLRAGSKHSGLRSPFQTPPAVPGLGRTPAPGRGVARTRTVTCCQR